jgi:hypothetical protein
VSFTTWTPSAVASERQPFDLSLWRAVEAQHVVSTMALVDNLDEQQLLEDILDAGKPPVPPAAHGLHYLLFTPFRYPPSPYGSRFRAPHDPGIFYGAPSIRTACAELGYWRWRFLMDSPALTSIDARPQTVFAVCARAQGISLDQPPFNQDADQWCHPSNYAPCQAMARIARQAEVSIIRYASVRDPGGLCHAVLEPGAFCANAPFTTTTWMLTVRRDRVIWQRDDLMQREQYEFEASRWVAPSH